MTSPHYYSYEEPELQLHDLSWESTDHRRNGTAAGTTTTRAGASTTATTTNALTDELIAQFNTSVGSKNLERSIAEFYLEMCNQDVEKSAQYYIEQHIDAELSASQNLMTNNSNNNQSLRSIGSNSFRVLEDSFNNSNGSINSTAGRLNNTAAAAAAAPRARRQLPRRAKSVEAAERPVITAPIRARGSKPSRSKSDGADPNINHRYNSRRSLNTGGAVRRSSQIIYGNTNLLTEGGIPIGIPLDPKDPLSVKQAASSFRERINNSRNTYINNHISAGNRTTTAAVVNIMNDNINNLNMNKSMSDLKYPKQPSTSSSSASYNPSKTNAYLNNMMMNQSMSELRGPPITTRLPQVYNTYNTNSNRRNSDDYKKQQTKTRSNDYGANNNDSTSSSAVVILPTDVIISRPPTAIKTQQQQKVTPKALNATAAALAARNRAGNTNTRRMYNGRSKDLQQQQQQQQRVRRDSVGRQQQQQLLEEFEGYKQQQRLKQKQEQYRQD